MADIEVWYMPWQLCVTCKGPLSEHWRGLPCPCAKPAAKVHGVAKMHAKAAQAHADAEIARERGAR